MSSLLKIKKEELKDHEGDFSFQVTEVSHFTNHAVDQELFDSVFGKDVVKDEKGFRDKIAEGLKAQLQGDSDYRFLQDVREYCAKKVGQLTYPDELLKRILLAANKGKDEKFVDENYDVSIKQLTWQLIRDQLLAANNIKVEQADVQAVASEMARAQFIQYGMNNVPDEYIENYAKKLLEKRENVEDFANRASDMKLTQALKNVVKLDTKDISIEDFNKLGEEK